MAPSVEATPAVDALLAELGQAFAIALIEEPTVDLPPQGYRLRVGGDGIDVVAPDRAGLLHAAATLRQWLRAPRHARRDAPIESIATVEIEDWPDFPTAA